MHIVPPEGQFSAALNDLGPCCDEVKQLMSSNKLKLSTVLKQCEVSSFQFDGSSISFSEKVRDLGVIMDDISHTVPPSCRSGILETSGDTSLETQQLVLHYVLSRN